MDSGPNGANRHVVLMAFGLPLMTTVIVIGSMYAGHMMTTRSERPTNVLVTAAPPNIDVNVPQSAPPSVNVTAPPATVAVHVPQSAPPTVNVTTPPAPAPNITVNPAAPTVTIIEREKERKEDPKPTPSIFPPIVPSTPQGTLASAATTPSPVPATPATTPVPEPVKPVGEFKTPPATPATPAPATNPAKVEGKPGDPGKGGADAASTLKAVREGMKSAPDKITSAPVAETAQPVAARQESKASVPSKSDDLSLDTLYKYATQYVDAYCRKNGLDPVIEERKWSRTWKASVDQAISDNIDSTEQSYINRIVIAKRDYFNIEKATPDKIVEACRIMLRYRDGQFAWLSAMKEALTEDNLKKTVAFLAAGPK